MPDSPNPSPTQEVGKRPWEMKVCPVHGPTKGPCREVVERTRTHTRYCHMEETVEVVAVAKHQAALQAEVEKREEVEGQLEAERERIHRVVSTPNDHLRKEDLVLKLDAAESKLSSAVKKLTELGEEAERRASSITGDPSPETRAVEEGARAAFGEALDLLRDKGTEQGGACEHGNTFDCPDCRLDVLELLDDEEVSIEGDPGLGKRAGWVGERAEFRAMADFPFRPTVALCGPTEDRGMAEFVGNTVLDGDAEVERCWLQVRTVTKTQAGYEIRSPWRDLAPGAEQDHGAGLVLDDVRRWLATAPQSRGTSSLHRPDCEALRRGKFDADCNCGLAAVLTGLDALTSTQQQSEQSTTGKEDCER